MPQANEFDQLLDYLQDQKNPVRSTEPKPQTRAEANIKLNPSDYHADVPSAIVSIPAPTSRAFDSKKFRELAKKRLVDEYLRKQAYVKPYNSVTEILNCVRQNYYYRSQYRIDTEKYFNFEFLQLYADVGTAIHEYAQRVYPFDEVKKSLISENYKVKGEADALTQPFLFEIKSVDYKKFDGNYRLSDFHQGNIYAYILNTEYKYRLSTVTLLYFFRDGLNRNPYPIDVPVDNSLAISFLERSLILNEALLKNKVPDKIGATDEKCRYCMFKAFCAEDSKNKETIPEKILPKSTFSM